MKRTLTVKSAINAQVGRGTDCAHSRPSVGSGVSNEKHVEAFADNAARILADNFFSWTRDVLFHQPTDTPQWAVETRYMSMQSAIMIIRLLLCIPSRLKNASLDAVTQPGSIMTYTHKNIENAIRQEKIPRN